MTKIRAWYAGLPDPVKAGCAMFAMAFLGLFVPALLGWLSAVQDWLAGGTAEFPDPSVLGKAAVAAATAGFLGVINWAFRAAQRRFEWMPGSGPHYEDADGGIELRAAGPRHALRPEPFPEPRRN